MKKLVVAGALIFSGTTFAGCNFGNSEALTIGDFEYMEKSDLTKYYCGSMVTVKMYDSLASDFKNSMPSLAKNYVKGGGMCRTEIKRTSMVLAKKYGVSKKQLDEMVNIINGKATSDNIQRCQAVAN